MPSKSKNHTKGFPPIEGYAWRFGDDISTDDIISGVHLALPSIDEMAPHSFENVRPEFARKVKPNDMVVGGINFGIGSSREEAPAVLRSLRAGAVIAASFARIFFRNAYNLGFPAIEVPALASDPELILDGDQLKLHMDQGSLLNHRTGETLNTTRIPPFLLNYIKAGGALPLLKQKLMGRI